MRLIFIKDSYTIKTIENTTNFMLLLHTATFTAKTPCHPAPSKVEVVNATNPISCNIVTLKFP